MALKRAVFITVLIVLLLDQWSKIWIKTHFVIGQEFQVFDWFIIHFTENNGMAFGLEFGGEWGKIMLSFFRIAVTIWLGFFIKGLIRQKAHKITTIAFSLVLAGAIGNIIDSVFYGVFFNESTNQLATFLPTEGGYAPFFQGRVVDMLYFPLFKGFLPDWIPFVAGDYFVFFRPVFNIADTAITTGVLILFIFHKKAFPTN